MPSWPGCQRCGGCPTEARDGFRRSCARQLRAAIHPSQQGARMLKAPSKSPPHGMDRGRTGGHSPGLAAAPSPWWRWSARDLTDCLRRPGQSITLRGRWHADLPTPRVWLNVLCQGLGSMNRCAAGASLAGAAEVRRPRQLPAGQSTATSAPLPSYAPWPPWRVTHLCHRRWPTSSSEGERRCWLTAWRGALPGVELHRPREPYALPRYQQLRPRSMTFCNRVCSRQEGLAVCLVWPSATDHCIRNSSCAASPATIAGMAWAPPRTISDQRSEPPHPLPPMRSPFRLPPLRAKTFARWC